MSIRAQYSAEVEREIERIMVVARQRAIQQGVTAAGFDLVVLPLTEEVMYH